MNLSRILLVGGIGVVAAGLFWSCGSDSDDDDTGSKTPTETVTFTAVAPIITESCVGVGSGCHNNTTSNTFNWEDATDSTFVKGESDYDRFKARLDQGTMPPGGSSITLSSADKATLQAYFK